MNRSRKLFHEVYRLDPAQGFEGFASQVHKIIEDEGLLAFYVFDCLTGLLDSWYSDVMIGNFFRVTCPFLFSLNTVAYSAVIRDEHTTDTVARIREMTQGLLDLSSADGDLYIHPLKVWQRYSPTMFFPHRINGDRAESITASADAARLFSNLRHSGRREDYWDKTLGHAWESMDRSEKEKTAIKKLLVSLMISRPGRISELANRYFTLEEILHIASREIGSGLIGGKSVGMLLARKILETDCWTALSGHWEAHDSFYIGSDVFYTYIVQNGWWELRLKQKTPVGYFECAPELRENLKRGVFPDSIREQFIRMLEHYGQSPIIVRSSSLQEDNFGNAFAGKYESVFCANQGTPAERLAAFEDAVRAVYASCMNDDALHYRQRRGLAFSDEQMAILVQRVSGDNYGDYFFPHIAGVGNSSNLYIWDRGMDSTEGMLRLVFGLGTRAVDRVSGDYARLISLDNPRRLPPISGGDASKFSQRRLDVINMRENRFETVRMDKVTPLDMKADMGIFFSPDYEEGRRLRELGIGGMKTPQILDFKGLISDTDFPDTVSKSLKALHKAYDYPVDIEFAVNFTRVGEYRFNLLQCRPLQTRGLGKAGKMPETASESIVFSTSGDFMGGNAYLDIDVVVVIDGAAYLSLREVDKYTVARKIGELGSRLSSANVSFMLIGPGRWGTSTASLGLPVHFTEIADAAVLCETSHPELGFMPELSYGSHFFQDIVESGIFYVAILQGRQGVEYHPDMFLKEENLVDSYISVDARIREAIHVSKTPGLRLYSDITEQRVLCFFQS